MSYQFVRTAEAPPEVFAREDAEQHTQGQEASLRRALDQVDAQIRHVRERTEPVPPGIARQRSGEQG